MTTKADGQIGMNVKRVFSLMVCVIVLFAFIVEQSTATKSTNKISRYRKYRTGDQLYKPKVECGSGPPFFKLDTIYTRISGGMSLYPGQYPSFVSVKIIGESTSDYTACSGVLIDDDIVLTAAHCFAISSIVTKIIVSPSTITTKNWDKLRPVLHEAEIACISTDYDGQVKKSDYAFIKLLEPVKLTDKVSTACLPSNQPDDTTDARAVGQGATYITPNGIPTLPELAQVLPVRRAKCPPEWQISDTNICFKDYIPDYKGDTCGGDSGGPIYTMQGGKHTVAALISGSPKKCRPGASAVFRGADLGKRKNRLHVLKSIKQCIDSGVGAVFPFNPRYSSYRANNSEDECQ